MTGIEGFWYHGTSSQATAAKLVVQEDQGIRFIALDDERELWRCDFDDIAISDELGTIARRLTCAHQQQFVTQDNAAINALMQRYGKKSSSGVLHWLEKHWLNAVFGLCISAVLIGLFAWKGVPAISAYAANYVPPRVIEYVSTQSMDYFDQYLFSPSTIKAARQQQLRDYLQLYSTLPVSIEFRQAGVANAFALPSGLIVFTDEFIELAEHDEEILAVFLHEVGHVHHQHGLKMVIQSSIWSFMIALWIGDANAIAEFLLSLPVILSQRAFSRTYENESDDYAYTKMLEHNIDLNRFADIMERLMQEELLEAQENGQEDDKLPTDGDESAQDEGYMGYFSTHPATKGRIEKFRKGAKLQQLTPLAL